ETYEEAVLSGSVDEQADGQVGSHRRSAVYAPPQLYRPSTVHFPRNIERSHPEHPARRPNCSPPLPATSLLSASRAKQSKPADVAPSHRARACPKSAPGTANHG